MFPDELKLPEKFDWWNVRALLEEWAWKLVNSSQLVPVGTVALFAGTTAPDGWVACDNAEYEQTKYPELYAIVGTTYGGTATTFRVPPTAAVPVGALWIVKV